MGKNKHIGATVCANASPNHILPNLQLLALLPHYNTHHPLRLRLRRLISNKHGPSAPKLCLLLMFTKQALKEQLCFLVKSRARMLQWTFSQTFSCSSSSSETVNKKCTRNNIPAIQNVICGLFMA